MTAASFRGGLVFALAFACTPPSVMDFHRTVLDPEARGALDCTEFEVEDTTPEGFGPIAGDPQARRYTVSGCEREVVFTCFSPAYGHGTEEPECRPLRRTDGGAGGGVYIGTRRVR